MVEDGEEDTVHRGCVLEDPHGRGSSADLAETAFDGVGGSHGFALCEGVVAKAGQKLVVVLAQAVDGCGVDWASSIGEAAGGRARLLGGVGPHDGVQIAFEGFFIGLFDLVEDIADLVRPVALEGDSFVDHGQGG